MNNEIHNISSFDDAPDSALLSELKLNYGDRNEFEVPENYFEELTELIPVVVRLESVRQKSSNDDIRIAENEMSDLTARILTTSDAADNNADEDFFVYQKRSILAKIELNQIEAGSQDIEMNEEFFDRQRVQILSAVEGVGNRVISIRRWRKNLLIYTSAAAVVLIAFLLFNPGKTKTSETASFEKALQNTTLDDEDLKYILEGDEYESFLIETGMTDDEHKTIDSLIVSTVNTEPSAPANNQYETPKSVNSKKDIKPNEVKTTPSWDDLSEDEILEYLYHDADDTEILDELH